MTEIPQKKFAFVRLEAHEFQYDSSSESIGIGYLASILRDEGIETQIFDNTIENNAQLKNHIEKFSPDFLGYTSNHRNTMDVIDFDKKLSLDKEPIVIWGGTHATFSWYDLLKDYESIDVVVLGEAEKTLPELIEYLNEGYSFESVKGIAYKKEGKPVLTGYREAIVNLDTIPLPARDVLRGHLRKGGNKIARVLSSRGCFYNCSFCITPSMREVNPGKTYRERNPLFVVDEMERLNKKYGITTFYFNDDLFFTKNPHSRKRVIGIAEELLSRGLKVNYKVELRADSIDTDKDGDFIDF